MADEDFYNLLGVKKGSGKDEMKKAYRKLAMKYHPDRNPDDAAAERKFKEINHAYEILKDDQKRAAYDRFGAAAFEQGGPGHPGAGGGPGFASGFADIFDEMFGDFAHGGGARRGGGGGGAQGRGSDMRYNMEITLEEAFKGKKTNIHIPSSVACGECKGTGAVGGAAPVNCVTCHGNGSIRSQSGFFTVERTCPSCQGAGKVIKEPCHNCAGTGRQQKGKTLSVSIPAGVEDGSRIRLNSEGEAGLRGAPSGDLYIFLSIETHKIFQRDGADIYCRVPTPMTIAALGGHIEVPTVEGTRARVTVPPGTQTGQQFRLKSTGMTIMRSKARGDMFVQIMVETPVKLTKKQKQLLEEFAKDSPSEKHSPESHGFFSKVKEMWEDLKD